MCLCDMLLQVVIGYLWTHYQWLHSLLSGSHGPDEPCFYRADTRALAIMQGLAAFRILLSMSTVMRQRKSKGHPVRQGCRQLAKTMTGYVGKCQIHEQQM